MFEGTNIEFKELDRKTGKLPETMMREVVAFLNTDGGDIFIGIRNDRSIVGVKDPDDVITKLSSAIGDSILPNPLPFIRIDTVEIDGKLVVKCSVSTGVEKPYFIMSRGLTPEGVYIRVGAACRNVNINAIREMILESSGKSYEENRSLIQQLTFATMQTEMQKRGLAFDLPQMQTLKMIGADGLYTNLALLLSDQCPFETKVALFDGDFFRDRQSFTGSLLKQLNDVYQLLNMNNKTAATFQGLLRTDVRDYPSDALREALLNSIVHRNYSMSSGNIINIRDDQIEVISLGGLVPNISYEAIFLGVSHSRNPNLAAVFYHMRLIESYGTGIHKIISGYADFEKQPEFQTAEGVFRVVLPNVNFDRHRETIIQEKPPAHSRTLPYEQENKILAFAQANGFVTRSQVEEVLCIGSTKAYRILTKLCETNKIKMVKNGRKTIYRLI